MSGSGASGADAVGAQVVVVRHADYVPGPGGADPSLSAAGAERARALAHVLRTFGLTKVIVSQFARTQQTAAPAAKAADLTPQIIDGGDIAAIVAAVRAEPADGAVLVVGHSDTVPAIVAGLGGGVVPPIAATEFDRLSVVATGRSAHLRYGR